MKFVTKTSFLMVAIFIVLHVPSSSSAPTADAPPTVTPPEEKGIIARAIDSLKAILSYAKSSEFVGLIKSIFDRLNQAPKKAVGCFREASEGTQGDRKAAMESLNQALKESFQQDDTGNKSMFEKLLSLAKRLGSILINRDIGKKVLDLGSQFKIPLDKSLACFMDEVKVIKEDVDKNIEIVKSKFLQTK